MNSSQKNDADERMPEAVRKKLAAKRLRRRIIFAALGVLPFVLIGWWLWSNESGDRAIQAEIDRYIAAGEPIYPADFDPPPTDDENNAALTLKNAATALVLDIEDSTFDFAKHSCNPKQIAKHHDEFRRIIKSNSKVFELVRQARSMTGADWGIRMRTPVINFILPNLSDQKQLVKFLCSTAIYHHQRGNDAEAVELLRDALSAARVMHKMPILVGHLVAIVESALVCSTIEDIAVDLKVLPTGASAISGATKKQDVQALIAELLDKEELRKSAQRSFYGERAFVFDTAMLCLDGRLNFSSIGISPKPGLDAAGKSGVLKPFLKKDIVRMLRYTTAQAEAAGQTNWPAAKQKMPQAPKIKSALDRLTHALSSILLPTLTRAMERDFQARAMRRMAAVALAIRLYEIDNGRRPSKLADLVPKYLPAIPDDPFDEPGQSLRYLPNAQRPILYSISSNGKDDGGQYANDPDDPPRYDDYDIPFFLNGGRPRYEEEEQEEQEPASQPRTAPHRFGGRGMRRRSKPTPSTMPR